MIKLQLKFTILDTPYFCEPLHYPLIVALAHVCREYYENTKNKVVAIQTLRRATNDLLENLPDNDSYYTLSIRDAEHLIEENNLPDWNPLENEE